MILLKNEANQLFQLVEKLQVPYGYEKSFQLSKNDLSNNRFLISINKLSLGVNALKKVLHICNTLALPIDFSDIITDNFNQTKFIHFGFEKNASKNLYKIYLELATPLNYANSKYILLHLGLKWNACNRKQAFLTRYISYQSLSNKTILKRIEDIYDDKNSPSYLLVDNLVNLVKNDKNLNYLEVTEDGNSRKSYDINFYDAEFKISDLEPTLLKMCKYYAIDSYKFNTFYHTIKAKQFGHLAGGIHRNGQEFFNIYYGVEAKGE